MDMKNILAHCDHILFKQEPTRAQIEEIYDNGLKYSHASVCIPALFARQAADYVGSKLKICTVIGLFNGCSTATIKVSEIEGAIRSGADEIGMVIDIGWVKDQRWDEVLAEIKTIRASCQGHTLKAIVKTYLLTEVRKTKLYELVTKSGTDYVETSTGFSTGGVTREGVALFKVRIGPDVKIRATGGISGPQDTEDFMALGTDHLGASRIVGLVRDKYTEGY